MNITLKLCAVLSIASLYGCAAGASFEVDPTVLPDSFGLVNKHSISTGFEVTKDYDVSLKADVSKTPSEGK